jgi:hypothetical protein
MASTLPEILGKVALVRPNDLVTPPTNDSLWFRPLPTIHRCLRHSPEPLNHFETDWDRTRESCAEIWGNHVKFLNSETGLFARAATLSHPSDADVTHKDP